MLSQMLLNLLSLTQVCLPNPSWHLQKRGGSSDVVLLWCLLRVALQVGHLRWVIGLNALIRLSASHRTLEFGASLQAHSSVRLCQSQFAIRWDDEERRTDAHKATTIQAG
jgi:hypothetical protein